MSKEQPSMYPPPNPGIAEMKALTGFRLEDPFTVLGPRGSGADFGIRAFSPRSVKAWVLPAGSEPVAMVPAAVPGVWEYRGSSVSRLPAGYRLRFEGRRGEISEVYDPYAFAPEFGELDQYFLAEGNHIRLYDRMGAHLKEIAGVRGVQFAVWAPNAVAVSVIGDFNGWAHGEYPMKRMGGIGVWALFVPGLAEGDMYKFAVKGCDGVVREKTDPYAFWTEKRPRTACRVARPDRFEWTDGEWIDARARRDALGEPLSIYELHPGSWKRNSANPEGFLGYRDLAHEVVAYLKEMGYTHVELMPVMEHPLDESWGYQVINHFAPSSRFGNPEDFAYFVNYCHRNGIGVILDWVPAHFPTDPHGLANFDGREIYAYDSWKRREHKDWGTFVFDYGRNEVRNFLLASALFWFDRYHIDGLRVDAVASMIYLDYSRADGEWEPNIYGGNENLEAISFLKRFNEIAHGQFPGILTIAEESTAYTGVSRPTYLGGLGFSLKWNMGWMHDTLKYFERDPVHRKFHQGMLTFSLLYAFTENFVLPISHDEVVHGKRSLLDKMPGDDWQKFANLRLFLGYLFAHPGKKLLFMGCEFGQWQEWNCKASIDWHLTQYDRHRQIQQWMKDLNRVYRNFPALHEIDFGPEGFEWIDFHDADSGVLSFLRWSRERRECVAGVFNLTPVARKGYRIGAPRPGFWREILNSDAREYGGSGVGNAGGRLAYQPGAHGKPYGMDVDLPPLGALFFRHEG